MSDRRETVADIIAEMRTEAKSLGARSSLMFRDSSLALFVYPFANRIETAWRREREALSAKAAEKENSCSANDTGVNKEKKPLRNCDIGTAEEQYKMWRTFCNKYDNDCTGCPFDGNTCNHDYCFAKWLQMPYDPEAEKKGGAE